VPHLTFIHVIYLWGGLLSLPVALLIPLSSGAEIVWSDPISLLALLALVLFPTLIGHSGFNFAVRHISLLTVSFFTLIEPVTNTLTAALILGEIPRLVEVPGYLLFLGATLLYLLSRCGRFSSERSGSGRA
jgi:drug/metabolite transporter (DMT)-like permease